LSLNRRLEKAKEIFDGLQKKNGRADLFHLADYFSDLTDLYGPYTISSSDVYTIFQISDRVKDGRCDWKEFQHWVQNANAARHLFVQSDADSDGDVSIDELNAQISLLDAQSQQPSAATFKKFDTDGNGSLSFVEFLRMVTKDGKVKLPIAERGTSVRKKEENYDPGVSPDGEEEEEAAAVDEANDLPR